MVKMHIFCVEDNGEPESAQKMVKLYNPKSLMFKIASLDYSA